MALDLTLRLLQCVAETVCGTDAATEFLNLFMGWIASANESNDDMLVTSARAMAKNPRGLPGTSEYSCTALWFILSEDTSGSQL